MIGWIIEVAYVHLVGGGDDITLSTNFTGAVSNEVHVYRCYANIPANTWTIYVCSGQCLSMCVSNPAATGVAIITDTTLYCTTSTTTSSGNMYSHAHVMIYNAILIQHTTLCYTALPYMALPYMALPYMALQYTLLQNTQHLQVP